jgi:hypothetical protein
LDKTLKELKDMRLAFDIKGDEERAEAKKKFLMEQRRARGERTQEEEE